MISDAVYEQVVAELDEVRKEWQRGIHETSLAVERAKRAEEEARKAWAAEDRMLERATKAEAELREATIELEVRKRELKTCIEARRELEAKLSKSEEI